MTLSAGEKRPPAVFTGGLFFVYSFLYSFFTKIILAISLTILTCFSQFAIILIGISHKNYQINMHLE